MGDILPHYLLPLGFVQRFAIRQWRPQNRHILQKGEIKWLNHVWGIGIGWNKFTLPLSILLIRSRLVLSEKPPWTIKTLLLSTEPRGSHR